MCGIVGYIGPRVAQNVLLDGLRRLEYRGYDSAGMSTFDDGEIKTVKAAGKVADLASALKKGALSGTTGIAHTRWATHGAPTEANAHPHLDCQGKIAVVHNGIIENYEDLRRKMLASGHQLRSETDTEVLSHLLEEQEGKSVEERICAVLHQVVGTFGFAALFAEEPRKLYVARRGSPLVVGLGKNRDEFFLSSDPAAIIPYTKDIIYLDDDELAVLSDDGVETFTLDRERKDKTVERLEMTVSEVERGGYPHFMAKEINEQPSVVKNAVRGRMDLAEGRAVLGGLTDIEWKLRDVERVSVVGCGTAYLAGLLGAQMIREVADMPAVAYLASEFRYGKHIFNPKTEAVIAVSQSGETADTIGALRDAKERGAVTVGVVNTVGSTIARETDAGLFVHAGPEIAVASTKAFVAQVSVFALIAAYLGRKRKMSRFYGERLLGELDRIPDKIARILAQDEHIRMVARKYCHSDSMMFIGRKFNAVTAYEGALKMKEISYVHAEGYAAGELKHGPIALLDPAMPVVAVCPKDSVYDKMRSNIEEVRARRAPIIAVAHEGDESVMHLTEDVIYVPRTLELLSPILNVVPLQLLAYHTAVARGLNPDKPRNLAKSVTVE
ncbi:glutamine--fructose-6-phosphate transaminase (isomerizing) [Patescibacteria group bacterium]